MDATMSHGGKGVCSCEVPLNPPSDMPPKCQAISLVEDWDPDWDSRDRTGPGASKARYDARRIWASKIGITGIRVDLPACVKKVILDRYGPGTSTFVAGPNNCRCVTCATYRAEQEVAVDDAIGDAAV